MFRGCKGPQLHYVGSRRLLRTHSSRPARDSLSPQASKYYPIPLWGPVLLGTIAGCGGLFLPLDKGLKVGFWSEGGAGQRQTFPSLEKPNAWIVMEVETFLVGSPRRSRASKSQLNEGLTGVTGVSSNSSKWVK